MDKYKLASGDEVAIARSFGCNLFSWKTGGAQMFFAPEGFTSSIDYFYKGGNPILFPAVGRTWDCNSGEAVAGIYGVFGKTTHYSMPTHGILTLTEWNKPEVLEQPRQVQATYSLMIPDIVKELSYPFDLQLSLRYTLTPGSVEIAASVTNTGSETAPFAYGLHPYFALGADSAGSARVEVPAQSRMVLDPELLVPTDQIEDAPSGFSLDKGESYDCVYTQLTGNRATLRLPAAGKSVHIDFDENIENLVIYKDADQPAVCIEPWTRGLGAFSSISQQNWEQTRVLNTLEEGESRQIVVRYSIKQF